MTVQIIILAMIAAFLGLRLYSVLGRRADQEEETIEGRFGPAQGGNPLPPQLRDGQARDGQGGAVRQLDLPPAMPAVERGLREIAAADRRFDAFAFIDGARGAYGMILDAFWRADREELAQLTDRDVYESFCTAIDARIAAGEVLENRLVRIEDAIITAASFTAPMARITVRFTADIAAVTRDAAGTVIAGSLTDAVQAIDIWTFSRNIQSAEPDWLLDETDEG